MKVKGITDEDFCNYKVPSMYIATATCSFKCDKECGRPVCQNSELAKQPDIEIDTIDIVDRYCKNPITHAIVIGGLEPLDQLWDVYSIMSELRYAGSYDEYQGVPNCDSPKGGDDIVIYTGYTKDEVTEIVARDASMKVIDGEWKLDEELYQEWMKDKDKALSLIDQGFPNIIVKFGRYIPGQQPHYDPVLGVYLASDNQYAERIS